MKHISLLAVFCCIIALTACDKQKLPYDLEGVEHGVIINISKVAGTSTTLSTDMNAGDYQVELSVPNYYQGDMSMFKEAQLMAVYTDTEGKKTPAYVVEGIKEFPAKLKLNIKDVDLFLCFQSAERGYFLSCAHHALRCHHNMREHRQE